MECGPSDQELALCCSCSGLTSAWHPQVGLKLYTLEDATFGYWLQPWDVRHVNHTRFRCGVVLRPVFHALPAGRSAGTTPQLHCPLFGFLPWSTLSPNTRAAVKTVACMCICVPHLTGEGSCRRGSSAAGWLRLIMQDSRGLLLLRYAAGQRHCQCGQPGDTAAHRARPVQRGPVAHPAQGAAPCWSGSRSSVGHDLSRHAGIERLRALTLMPAFDLLAS